jgi:hypothetical protein
MAAVRKDGLVLQFACDVLKRDRNIIAAGVCATDKALAYGH